MKKFFSVLFISLFISVITIFPDNQSSPTSELKSNSQAAFTVSGRILTGSGRGIFLARLTVSGPGGETKMVITNPFGFYRIGELQSGRTFTIKIEHKRYEFEPQTVTVSEPVEFLNFFPKPAATKLVLDDSFGNQGIIINNTGREESAIMSLLQPDGKIIVVGAKEVPAGLITLYRYNRDGSADPGFGNGRTVFTDIRLSTDRFSTPVALQTDGKIVIGGRSETNNFAFRRFQPDGSFDKSFGSDGLQTLDFGGNSTMNAVLIQRDGKILAAGTTTSGDINGNFAVARLNNDGSVDQGFGSNGKVVTNMVSGDRAFSLAIQPDGKIIVGGAVHNSFAALARYNSDGSLDAKFGNNGKFVSSRESLLANNLILQADGKIIAAGEGLLRVNSNGTVDTTFGNAGVGGAGSLELTNAAIRSDGTIIISGRSFLDPAGNFGVALLNPNNGELIDRVDDDFLNGSFDEPIHIAVQTDGALIIVGRIISNTRTSMIITRYKVV